MKRVFLSVLCFIMLFCTACSSEKSEDIKLDGLAQHILNNVEFEDKLDEIDKATACVVYGLNEEGLDFCEVYMGTGATAEEIAVFDVKDEDSFIELTSAITERIETRIESFSQYIPKEVKKLENPLIYQSGTALVLCICDDPVKAQSEIEAFSKK